MTSEFTAYLIEPSAGTIRYVTVDRKDRLNSLYRLIGCSMVDAITIGKKHMAYCDDNGLSEGLQAVSELVGHPSPLAGNLVVTGLDEEGDTISPHQTISAIADLFSIVRPVFDPVFEEVNQPGTFGVALTSLGVRIERQRPIIISA
ncbi:DUF3846 domain-containing protein [Rhizobium wenxiniae]|uniref:DUF3846 domain-containing protein n=1 Tax=Rhizobium wenxiniae TaxID=1737357 RepID=UPI003C1EBE2C